MKAPKIVVFFLVILIAVSASHCKSLKNSASQKATYKSIYIDQFKLTYFRQLLDKGFNHSEAFQQILSFDHSGFQEPILTMADLKLIDSLTTADNAIMQKDSINSIGRKAEGAEGKQPFYFILDKMGSKFLDSLARKSYQRSGLTTMYDD